MTAAPSTRSDSTGGALAKQLKEQGLVMLPEPLPANFVNELRQAVEPMLDGHVGAGAEPNRGTRRHQMYLPFKAPFSDPALWANPTVLPILEQVLGPDFECIYLGTDTPYPGSEHQPLHQDGAALFPEWEHRPPTYCVALNVYLVDVDETNGPLEWFSGIERPRPDVEPNQFTGPAGSILLRDTRIWHRGSPNNGDAPRPMVAVLYCRPWYRFPVARPVIDRTVYEQLPDPGPRLFQSADLIPLKQPAAARVPQFIRDAEKNASSS